MIRSSHTLSIGNLKLSSPFVQAALSGYSDWPMRVMAHRMGASYAVCEVMLDRFLVDLKHRRKYRHYLQTNADDAPAGGQLMGADPEHFGPAARRLVEAGFRVIDINFGCPVKKVLGRCRGGFHLSQPDTALEIVSRVREAVPDDIPITVKMRRGIDDSQISTDRFYEIFDGAYARGVSAITVHGRTVVQRYVGPSNWDFLREVKSHAGRRTVLGSGDLLNAQACVDMLHETGVDGVTIARGAIGNPWIFGQARALWAGELLPAPPTIHEQREALREHWGLAAEIYDEARCLTTMRKFGIHYAKLHPEYMQTRQTFVETRSPQQWWSVIEKCYTLDGPGRFPLVDEVDSTAANGARSPAASES